MTPDRSAPAPCPLCQSTDSTTIEAIPYCDIWENLASEWGANFSNSVRIAHTPAAIVELRDCSDCRLHYFSPACAGSVEFYSELTSTSASYYNEDKWEFGFARSLIDPKDVVLDVACGSGHFIQSIKNSVKAAIGIDTNPNAIALGIKRGLDVKNASVEEFSDGHEGKFQVVTAFQVLEHLDTVFPFVRAAYRCVSPGGFLVLSVPNRLRRSRRGFGSLDHPPHHMSRWDEEQFRKLAEMLQASLAVIQRERMTSAQIIGALRSKELPSMLPTVFPGREHLIKIASRAMLTFPMSYAFFFLGMHERLKMHGHSLVAVLKKP